MVEGNCTRLVLDVKRVDKPYAQPEYVINAARRACEIVTEMKAKHFVELICTGFNLDAMKAAHNCAVIAEVPIGMNSSRSVEGVRHARLRVGQPFGGKRNGCGGGRKGVLLARRVREGGCGSIGLQC
ncbi:MAG: hypothetical protein ACLSGF_06510 [Alistipes onderdonkii]